MNYPDADVSFTFNHPFKQF